IECAGFKEGSKRLLGTSIATNLGVVPAKAGTHNPREESWRTGNPESSPNYILWLWGPGSRVRAPRDDNRVFGLRPSLTQAYAPTCSPRYATAASRPPLPCGIFSALRPTSITPSVPSSIGALTWPI